ncbi:MAG: type I restriction enzyme HsdR N-terminal domain-containing protein, partial [Chlamydiia bacterium]|nr:type I restriction enzyme HsdR N-terminal domain-containing protein [Chlamydiia bacterium]
MTEEKLQIWDRQRRRYYVAQPEERIRQRLVDYLVEVLGFPKSTLLVEKGLKELPHLSHVSGLPNRRVDIVCYGRDIHPEHRLYPLLLIECKAVPLSARVQQQVVGYNHYVGAYFLAIANEDQIEWASFSAEQQRYIFQAGLPTYESLLSHLGLMSSRASG